MKKNETEKKVDMSVSDKKETVPQKTNKAANKRWLYVLTIVTIVFTGATVFFASNSFFKKKFLALNTQNEVLYDNLTERDSLINEYLETFAQIEQDLQTMQNRRMILSKETFDPEITDGVRERVLEEIQQLNTLLASNKQKIQNLEKKLKDSGIKIASLERKVKNIQVELEQKDSSITDLKMQLVDKDFMLAELNKLVYKQDDEIKRSHSIILDQNMELYEVKEKINTAYFTAGSYKELKEKGIAEKKGGLFGLFGKTKTISTDFPEEKFDPVDISKIDRIVLNAKDARLITEHPEKSYEIKRNDSLISYVEIKNPDEFWKITKYAVFETK